VEFHGSSFLVASSPTVVRPTRATSSRGCYEETVSVEFKLYSSGLVHVPLLGHGVLGQKT